MKKTLTILILLLTIFVSNVGGVLQFSEAEMQEMVQDMMAKLRVEDIRASEFSPQLLLEYMELRGIKHPEVVYKQAVLETGWFKHIRCTEYNNYFGMKKAKVREHCQLGVWKKHATYEHWTLSVDDYKYWQEYWEGEGYSQRNYYSFLSEVGYATAKNYTRTLKQI